MRHGALDPQRFCHVKVGVARAQVRHAWAVVKDIEKGVFILQVKNAARLEEMGDDLRPAAKIGEPTQHAARREDDIELFV